MRDILAGARKTHGCCGKPRISIPCNKEHLDAIFENLEKIFGYPKDMKSNCTEGEDPDEDTDAETMHPSMLALNQDSDTDYESDFGTFEEQTVKLGLAKKETLSNGPSTSGGKIQMAQKKRATKSKA